MHSAPLTACHPESKVVDENINSLKDVGVPKCVDCGSEVAVAAKQARYVKCEGCRKIPKDEYGKDSETRVACRICGLLRRTLYAHIKTAHGMTLADYRKQYPGVPLGTLKSRKRSTEGKAKQSAAATLRWASEEERAKQSARLKEKAPWKGKKLSPEHREAIGAGGRGVLHNLSDERRVELGEQGRRVLAENLERPDHREKLSQGQLRRVQRGVKIGFQLPGVWEKAHEAKIRNGNLQAPNAGRGITGFRKGLQHYCRSTLEANFARILLLEGIPYEYEPQVFKLPGGGRWTPDFRLLQSLGVIPAGWVELKGWRKKDGTLPGKATEKIQAFEAMTGEAVFVLCQCDPLWKMLVEVYRGKVTWERPGRNIKTHPDLFGVPRM